MSLDVRERSLGKNSLGYDSRESKHSQTSILQFTKLHTINLSFRFSVEESEGVKSKVTGLAAGLFIKHLHNSYRGNSLSNADPEEKLGHGSLLDESIVCGDGGEALVCLGEGVNSSSEVDSDESSPCEHADASVLEFCLTEEVHGGEVGEAEGVESYISYVSLEVRRVGEEGKSFRLLCYAKGSSGTSCRGREVDGRRKHERELGNVELHGTTS